MDTNIFQLNNIYFIYIMYVMYNKLEKQIKHKQVGWIGIIIKENKINWISLHFCVYGDI